KCRATRCQNASSSGRRCRSRAMARSPSAWCATSSKRAGCSTSTSRPAPDMRSIKQPGPPAPERIQWAEARGRAFSFTLEPGLTLLEAARRGFAAQGFAGGTLNIKGGTLGPFGYVMPALSKTGENAAFYSETFRPQGLTHLRLATMTAGQRDGAPFFHCHGLWTEADGRSSGGHMLPEETFVAEPFAVGAFGIDGAVFAAEPDPETNFKLFGPIPAL